MVTKIADRNMRGKRVRIGASDPTLTRHAGMLAVTELVQRLGLVEAIDTAVGPVKERNRGFSLGQVLVGMAGAQLAGQDFLVGLDRVRADTAGQELVPVPGLATSTACGIVRRASAGQWVGLELGLSLVHERMLALLPPARRDVLCSSATIDIDATDVEVYGRHKRGVAYNYQGQRCGRPDVACWAQAEVVLAADLLAGDQDPRSSVVALFQRALAGLPAQARAGHVRVRVDAGYFAGDLARAARTEGVGFAIGAKRIAPSWRLLSGIDESAWADALVMDDAQVAVADYKPAGWPEGTRLLIRRVALEVEQVSTDPRSRRRRTLHPDQRALPIEELAAADAIYAYSFIATDLDVATPERAVQVESWYRHRTTAENLPRWQARRRPGPPALRLSRGQHRVDVGRAARGQHRRLAAPADRQQRRARPDHRVGHPRRQGDDRHAASHHGRGPRAAGASRRAAHAAPTTGSRPPRGTPHPHPGPARHALTRHPQPEPAKDLGTREPRRDTPGPITTPPTTRTRARARRQRPETAPPHLGDLLVDSGQMHLSASA